MFRDESSKVIQKAHAQWGAGPNEQANPSSAVSASSSSSWSTMSPSSSLGDLPSPELHVPQNNVKPIKSQALQVAAVPKLHPIVEPTLEDKGIQFYMTRYLMNHPDAPGVGDQLEFYSNKFDAMRNVMVAVGLAGLSNTTGDRAMNLLSRQVYTTALKQTGVLIAQATKTTPPPGFIAAPLRAIVMLALFEVSDAWISRLTMKTDRE
jgi:hypothetical protein